MTIAQQIKWDFKTNGNLEILNKNGKRNLLRGLKRIYGKA